MIISFSQLKSQLFILFLLLPLLSFAQISKVTRIIDGDTFVVESGDKVRMIGINAPEKSDVFGAEATEHLQSLIEGKEIELKTDGISNDRDRYSRLLRYVYLNGRDINKQMLSDGYSVAYLKYHFEKNEEYRKAQLDAQSHSLGMWHNPTIKTDRSSQTTATSFTWTRLSAKVSVLIALVVILLFIGAFSYFRK